MKCTICGAEIPQNSEICINCGTKVSELTGNVRFSGNDIYNNRNFSSKATVSKKSNKYNVIFIAFLVAVILLVGLYLLYLNVLTKTIDEGSFTAKIPMNMYESKDSKSLDFASEGTHGKIYSNSKGEFGYVIMDLSSLNQTTIDLLGESFFLDLMEKEIKKGNIFKSYEKISKSDNLIDCYLVNNDGSSLYAKIYCKKSKDKIAIFIVDCEKSKKSSMEKKMGKWVNSIVMK